MPPMPSLGLEPAATGLPPTGPSAQWAGAEGRCAMSKPRTSLAMLRSPAQSVVLPLTAQVPPAAHGILREGATRLEAVSPMDAVAELLTGDQLLDGIAADTLEPINSRVISALTSDALPMGQSARNFAASFRWRMSRSSDVDDQDAGKRRSRKRRDHADLEAQHRDHGGCRKYGGAPATTGAGDLVQGQETRPGGPSGR